LFPPVVVNLLAGMAKMPWRTFLFYNLTGSAAYTITYILIGYYFGKEWKWLVARLGSTALCLILAGLMLIILGVIYRKSLSAFFAWHFSKERRRQ
jgi:membrane protein DedA with SNARE-associated domain